MNKKGQSTVEFALVLIFLMGFVLFNFQFTTVSAVGNYIQYATFMAARAYLSSGGTVDDQRQRAESVLIRTVKKSAGQVGADRWAGIAKGLGEGVGTDVAGALIGFGQGGIDRGNEDLSWMEGVRYKFRSRLLVLPLAPNASSGEVNSLTLTSESWLGRDVSYAECVEDMNTRMGFVMIDNGC